MVPTTAKPGADTLLGFRLVRRIGSGSRSEVFLAKPAVGAPDGSPVALKVFRADTEPAGMGRQVRALQVAGPAALPVLLDVATTPEGRVCLVLRHLPGLTLDRLLAERGRVGAGEVVTVAATVTATLQALHNAGLSHPLVQPSSVRFDDRGRPVLLGLGALNELPPGAAGVAMRRDAAIGLTGFLRCLLAYLDPADAAAPGAEELLAEFSSTVLARPFPASLAGLEAALFAWAPAGAVQGAVPGSAPGPAAEPAVPLGDRVPVPRLVSVAASEPAAAGPTPSLPVPRRGEATAGRVRRLRAVVGRRAAAGRRAVTTSLAVAARTGGARIDRARFDRTERSEAVGSGSAPARRLPGRRTLLLGSGLAVILSIGGLAALSAVPPESTARSGTAPGNVGTETPEHAPGQAGATPGTAEPEGVLPSVLTGDDPAAAVLELLRRRAECLAEASVLCLDGVDQPGSVLMAADGYRIRQLQTEPSAAPSAGPPAGPVTADVRERTGNAALVVLSGGAGVNAQPASALMIKGEAGWRLRELFDY